MKIEHELILGRALKAAVKEGCSCDLLNGWECCIHRHLGVLGKTYEQDLVEDMLALMSSFSNKIYGKRSAENRKARKLAEMAEKLEKSKSQGQT